MTSSKLPEIKPKKKTGTEKFHNNGTSLPFNLLSFWQWSSSDLLSNSLRGILAEFIVASAISNIDSIRKEWDAYDLEMPEGNKIEVKSASYIQSWSQKKLSQIQFNIRPTQRWDSISGTYSTKRIRQAEIYVFCILTHTDKDSIDPLNLQQWDFYIIETETLNQAVAEQKTITLSKLLKLNPLKVKYQDIALTITETLSNSSQT
ncbi:MAG: hypothetical protein HN390_06535 [Anaerolineae bacterium]|jgi:hypothetical protein|nr:hypothetical protein [Anaerolineae bacterium]MBT3711746.1 hypothetical protein [Anaerolineae bacterium]MBT7190144.1 hypothetical protein [Anaerolineae bacterium]MBT7989567.1 hypothetical protein [Anaerolineae bacterium]